MKKAVSLVLLVCFLLTFTVAYAAGDNKHLNILWGTTGYGNYVDYAIEHLEKTYDLDIDIEYNAKADEVLQPQILAGNPEDIVMVQQSKFDYFAAIEAGKFTDITEYLELPVEGSDKTVKEMANPAIIDALCVDGRAYVMMSNMNVGCICYDKTMFAEHGWEVPRCWDEFIALCEEIKTTTDIAPFIFPGMYPYYLRQVIIPMMCACGRGLDTLKDINNMEPGIWNSPEALEAAKRIQYMRDQGYFADGLVSMDHTTSQMEFVNGKVAMIACGSWLQNEMGDAWPEGFELGVIVDPTGATPDSEKFIQVNGTMMGFPADAANKEWIGEFLQFYFSEENAQHVAEDCAVVLSPAAIAENENVSAALSPFVAECFAAAAENSALTQMWSTWYTEFFAEWQNQLISLVAGNIDAEEYCDNVEALAQAVRDDDFITKYKLS